MTPQDRLRIDAARARLACDAVAFAFALDEPLLAPDRGTARAAFARQVAMYLTHVGFGLSLQRVATAFGRDRSTVAHACHLVEDRRDCEQLDHLLEALEDALKAAPAPGAYPLAA